MKNATVNDLSCEFANAVSVACFPTSDLEIFEENVDEAKTLLSKFSDRAEDATGEELAAADKAVANLGESLTTAANALKRELTKGDYRTANDLSELIDAITSAWFGFNASRI